jgi:hypothetical protein
MLNWEACRQRNLAMIKAIMGDVKDKLNTHRHIKHFRTDSHKYIDLNFNHVKDVPETMNARLEIVQEKDQAVPVLPEIEMRAPESARPSFVTGANRVPVNPSQTTGVTNIKLNVNPMFDKTNYQTEIMIEIEQKPFRIIADLGATSSSINLAVVKELNLLPNMKPTEYTYRTSSGKFEKVLGTVELSLRIGPIVLKTDMVVMPSGCGYNMLLRNELMTTLRADIMRSLKVVRFQVGNCITSVPMLPREERSGNPVEVYFKVDCKEPWINNKPPTIQVDREFWRSYRPELSYGPILAALKIETEKQGQLALQWARSVGYRKQNLMKLKVQMKRMARKPSFTEIKWIVPEHSPDPPAELKRLFIQAAEPPRQEEAQRGPYTEDDVDFILTSIRFGKQLTEAELTEIKAVVKVRIAAFSRDDAEMGYTTLIECEVDPLDKTPVQIRPYKLAFEEQREAAKFIEQTFKGKGHCCDIGRDSLLVC